MDNPSLHKYYAVLKSRLGYRFFLGGARHRGYYSPGTKWPFPITHALKRMEDHLFHSLELQPPARVLDAGCGAGRVAVRLASHGLKVSDIDVVDNHVRWARQEIRACGLESMVDVRLMDYHRLDGFADESFDAVYTMETLVHAIDPEKALGQFFRVMKPGASIALHEYDHPDFDVVAKDMPKELRRSIEQVNRRAAMPSNERLLQGDWKRLLEDQGFRDVVVQDLSENIMPLMRLFYLLARVPYFFICLLGLKARFVNTQAAISSFRSLQMGLGRYVAVTAKKPGSRG
ncbi:hypothetical protein MMC20_002747 [Loxospora ochrophaea]|nr:hypothetical protein [Loxospora ochrophaea]